MEKSFYEAFKLMELRGAVYNGKEIDHVPVAFNRDTLYKVDIDEVEAINMEPGDTVTINGKICSDEDGDWIYVDLYLSGDVLTEFIEKYGYKNITASVEMKLKLFYAVVKNDMIFENARECTGYEVLKIYPKNN